MSASILFSSNWIIHHSISHVLHFRFLNCQGYFLDWFYHILPRAYLLIILFSNLPLSDAYHFSNSVASNFLRLEPMILLHTCLSCPRQQFPSSSSSFPPHPRALYLDSSIVNPLLYFSSCFWHISSHLRSFSRIIRPGLKIIYAFEG